MKTPLSDTESKLNVQQSEESKKILKPEEVVSTIFTKHGFTAYQFKDHKEYFKVKNPLVRLKRKNMRNSSWCDYQPEGITTIYFKEEKTLEEGLIVSAHEACHALNYAEGKTDFHKLNNLAGMWKKTYFGVGIITSLLTIATIKGIVSFYVGIALYILLNILFVAAAVKFARYYQRDELITERRALEELIEIFAHEDIEPIIEERVRERIKKYINPIFKTQLGAALFASFFAFILVGYAVAITSWVF